MDQLVLVSPAHPMKVIVKELTIVDATVLKMERRTLVFSRSFPFLEMSACMEV